ncbi:hypothetical protein TRVL_04800 [Trypanosoma vivax]|nr:hypothetical protein TRVL_04800 [Trypanosoma vivax]
MSTAKRNATWGPDTQITEVLLDGQPSAPPNIDLHDFLNRIGNPFRFRPIYNLQMAEFVRFPNQYVINPEVLRAVEESAEFWPYVLHYKVVPSLQANGIFTLADWEEERDVVGSLPWNGTGQTVWRLATGRLDRAIRKWKERQEHLSAAPATQQDGQREARGSNIGGKVWNAMLRAVEGVKGLLQKVKLVADRIRQNLSSALRKSIGLVVLLFSLLGAYRLGVAHGKKAYASTRRDGFQEAVKHKLQATGVAPPKNELRALIQELVVSLFSGLLALQEEGSTMPRQKTKGMGAINKMRRPWCRQ